MAWGNWPQPRSAGSPGSQGMGMGAMNPMRSATQSWPQPMASQPGRTTTDSEGAFTTSSPGSGGFGTAGGQLPSYYSPSQAGVSPFAGGTRESGVTNYINGTGAQLPTYGGNPMGHTRPQQTPPTDPYLPNGAQPQMLGGGNWLQQLMGRLGGGGMQRPMGMAQPSYVGASMGHYNPYAGGLMNGQAGGQQGGTLPNYMAAVPDYGFAGGGQQGSSLPQTYTSLPTSGASPYQPYFGQMNAPRADASGAGGGQQGGNIFTGYGGAAQGNSINPVTGSTAPPGYTWNDNYQGWQPQ